MIEQIEYKGKVFVPEKLPIDLVRAKHDYELPRWYMQKMWNTDKAGVHRGWPRKAVGQPETVATFEKDDNNKFSDLWQDFNLDIHMLAVFRHHDMDKVSPSDWDKFMDAFDSVHASNRVINNKGTWWNDYMALGMGGNTYKLKSTATYRPNSEFGEAYKVLSLDSSRPPPNVDEVWNDKSYLLSTATISRYAKPEDDIDGLGNAYQHVIPFPQYDSWGAKVPLLLISRKGYVHIPTVRLEHVTEIASPFNPVL